MSGFTRRLQAAAIYRNVFTAFTPGSVKPIGSGDAGVRNVGPRLSNLTRHDGDITLTPGARISGLDIYGSITGRGDATTLVSDCIIRGPDHATAQAAMAVGQSYNFGGAVFEWCRFDGTGRESDFTDCIDGGNYTLRYCELTRGVDGIGADTVGNATIECCRIWNGRYDALWDDTAGAPRTTAYTDADGVVHDPPFITQASGDTHSDGAQIQSYGGWIIRGCYIGGPRSFGGGPYTQLDPTVAADLATIQSIDANMDYNNSAIIINSVSSANPVGALIELNWLEGGMARVNMAGTKSYDTFSGVTLQNNRFVRSTWASPGYYLYVAADCTATISGNVYDDDSTPVPIATA